MVIIWFINNNMALTWLHNCTILINDNYARKEIENNLKKTKSTSTVSYKTSRNFELP